MKRLQVAGSIVIATATDELVTYPISLQADQFEITDAEGCRVTYRRDTRTP